MITTLDLIDSYLKNPDCIIDQNECFDHFMHIDSLARHLPFIQKKVGRSYFSDTDDRKDIHDESFLRAKQKGLSWLEEQVFLITQQPHFNKTIEAAVSYIAAYYEKKSPNKICHSLLREELFKNQLRQTLKILFPGKDIYQALQDFLQPMLSIVSQEQYADCLSLIDPYLTKMIAQPKTFATLLSFADESSGQKKIYLNQLIKGLVITLGLELIKNQIEDCCFESKRKKRVQDFLEYLKKAMPFYSDKGAFVANQVVFQYAQWCLLQDNNGSLLLISVLESSARAYEYEDSSHPSCSEGLAERILLDCYAVSNLDNDYLPNQEEQYAMIASESFITSDQRPSPLFLSLALYSLYGDFSLVVQHDDIFCLDQNNNPHDIEQYINTLKNDPVQYNLIEQLFKKNLPKNLLEKSTQETLIKRFFNLPGSALFLTEKNRLLGYHYKVIKKVPYKRLKFFREEKLSLLGFVQQTLFPFKPAENLNDMIDHMSKMTLWPESLIKVQLSTLLSALGYGRELNQDAFETMADYVRSLGFSRIQGEIRVLSRKEIFLESQNIIASLERITSDLIRKWSGVRLGDYRLNLVHIKRDSVTTMQIKEELCHKILAQFFSYEDVWNALERNLIFMLIQDQLHRDVMFQYVHGFLFIALKFKDNLFIDYYIKNILFNTETKTIIGLDALQCAAKDHRVDLMIKFIQMGVDVHDVVIEEKPILIWATCCSYDDLVKELIKHKIKIHHTDQLGLSALEHALAQGNDRIASLLIQASSNSYDNNGYTPLHLAVIYNKESLLITCLKSDSNPLLLNKHGRTAAHLAVILNRYSMLECLLKRSSSKIFHIKDCNNKTILDWAYLRKRKEIIELIEEYQRLFCIKNPGRRLLFSSMIASGELHHDKNPSMTLKNIK